MPWDNILIHLDVAALAARSLGSRSFIDKKKIFARIRAIKKARS